MKLTNLPPLRSLAFLILGMLSILSLDAQTIKSKKYFPLVEGSRYTYKGSFEESVYTNDLVCKTQQTESGQTYFYFEDLVNGATIIGSNMFGLGSYQLRTEGIVTAETFWGRDLEELDQLSSQLLLPKKFKIQDPPVLEIDAGSAQKTVNFLRLEDISVPAGEYKNCLKVHIRTVWDSGTVYNEYIWLAKGVGMVKWQRATGRIDELTYFRR